MTQPPLYLLSGLCADERLFQFLTLDHPNPVILKWCTPAPEDTMASYSTKLIAQMTPSPVPPILVGLSFGGMVVQEIAKQMPVTKVILLSSLADTRQLPLHYRAGGWLQLQKWLPLDWFKHWLAPAHWLFGAKLPKEKRVFDAIIHDTDIPFLRWSLTQILNWRHLANPENTVAIHGDQDKILPVPHFKPLHVLPGGEHLMVMGRAQEVSALINRYLR
ncbi:alpha/beta fold hydrolase [Rufibacter sp. LB8]|uniref:alpha/beta fold hydrolase n=1 Tax=Rufibacter sp. LB8 TaxID=2777781 RepID=UPI00178C1B6C|nr:alpha/beta hydrolase [Rufibacter sp. LB8]